MADSKLDWMPFYGDDFFGDMRVRMLTEAQQSIYLRALWVQWREGWVPSKASLFSRVIRCNEPDAETLLSEFFVVRDEGQAVNVRLDLRRERTLTSVDAKREGAAKARQRKADINAGINPDTKADDEAKSIDTRSKSRDTRSKSRELREKPSPSAPRESWLTPFWDAWVAAFDGEPNGGQLARYLKPLVDEHGEQEVVWRWKRYLAQSDGKASANHFTSTWGVWGKLSKDEMDRMI